MCDAQALQWVADNVQYPAIVSTSIAGEHSAAVNQAVQSLINDYGITIVTAAGEPQLPVWLPLVAHMTNTQLSCVHSVGCSVTLLP